MRIAVVGAGRMGSIRSEDLRPGVEDLVIFNRSLETGSALASKFQAKAMPLDQLFDQDFDGYVVATATDAHAHWLTRLIEKGKPILCEKPIALTVEETDQIIDLADKHKTEIQIGFQRRFDAGIAKAQQAAVSGQLGVLYQMHMFAHDHEPSTVEFLAGSGGIFRDLHVHDFDLVRWITNSEVVSVYATKAVRVYEQYAVYDDADAALIHLVTQDGTQVSISGTRHNPIGNDVHMEIFGSKDSIAVGVNSRTPINVIEQDIGINQNPYLGFVDRFRAAFRAETQAFLQLVAGELPNPCPPSSAREALRIAIACEEAVATQRAVTLEH
ncbi:MAG: Gfo/Idh/MocA family oxidoreductase [Actinomycetota bacterium]|jgi:myo-inositol 2-dehydrogenase / D-chiro-inositol 1-dehydrogenase|nr:Gfo/Idh/MocA family oxidoreductase [Actinomycetota bacterium]